MQWLTWVPRFNTVWTCRTKAFSVAPYKQIDVCFRPPELENSRACRKLRAGEGGSQWPMLLNAYVTTLRTTFFAELKIPGLIYGAGDGKFPLMQARKVVYSLSIFLSLSSVLIMIFHIGVNDQAVTMSMVDVQRHWRLLGRSSDIWSLTMFVMSLTYCPTDP